MKENLENLIYELAYRIGLSDQIRQANSKDNPIDNLSPEEQLILETLYKKDRMRISDINSTLKALSPSNVSTMIKKLQREKSFVSKVRSEEDDRVVIVSLTEAGKKETQRIIKNRLEMYKIIVTALNMNDEDEKVLHRVVKNAVAFFDNFIQGRHESE